jgi:hypothetical protein
MIDCDSRKYIEMYQPTSFLNSKKIPPTSGITNFKNQLFNWKNSTLFICAILLI